MAMGTTATTLATNSVPYAQVNWEPNSAIPTGMAALVVVDVERQCHQELTPARRKRKYATVKSRGVASGNITVHNVRNAPAPSIRALSSISEGDPRK